MHRILSIHLYRSSPSLMISSLWAFVLLCILTVRVNAYLEWVSVKQTGFSPSPLADFSYYLSSNSSNPQFIIYGGDAGDQSSSDCFVFDLDKNEWNFIKYWPSPSRRQNAAFVVVRDKFYISGGFNGDDSTVYNDFWMYSDNEWTYLNQNEHLQRYAHNMVYIDDHNLFFYGGLNLETYFNSSFIYNIENYTVEFISGPSPPSRAWSGMTFDSLHKCIYLFGGWHYEELGDMWKACKQNLQWVQINLKYGPNPRSGAPLIYDGTNLVLFGGQKIQNNTYGAYNDFWFFNISNQAWARIDTTNNPPPRFGNSLVFLPTNSSYIIFGGADGVERSYNDMWSLSLQDQDVKQKQKIKTT